MPRIGPPMMIDRVPGTSRLLSLLLESRVWEAPFAQKLGDMSPVYSGPIWLVMSSSVLLARSIASVGSQKEDVFSSWFLLLQEAIPMIAGFPLIGSITDPCCIWHTLSAPSTLFSRRGLGWVLGRSHGGGTGRVSGGKRVERLGHVDGS